MAALDRSTWPEDTSSTIIVFSDTPFSMNKSLTGGKATGVLLKTMIGDDTTRQGIPSPDWSNL
eukprot:1653611-Rhodomonas_salina.1